MNQNVGEALDHFMQRYRLAAETCPDMLLTKYDQNWQSDCLVSNSQDGESIGWQPIKREVPGSFKDLSFALDMDIHPDLATYYTKYWSDNLNAKTEQGDLQLLQAWNQDDFERLQQNLVGHVLMKRRLKQPETLFFALTDQDDFILTIGNHSGEVLLEQVGLLPQQVLAANLAEFLHSLQPSS